MSYILQALKKSEQERKLAAQGSVVESLEASSSAGRIEGQVEEPLVDNDSDKMIPLSIYGWLGGFFILLLVITGYVNQRIGMGPAEKAEVMMIENAAISEPALLNLVAQEVVTPEIITKKVVAHKEAIKDSVVQKDIIPKAVIQTEMLRVIRPSIAVEQATKEVQSLIPDINISSHIYSSLAARRSIVVNGERLVETDFITPHVQVNEITHQGMIIEVDGVLLVVDRSRGWSR